MAAYPTDYRGWLAKLISFDTVSSKSNLDLIHYVRDYLQSVGVTDTHVIPAPDDKIHANLFATLPGEGGVKQGGIVLSGHSDVVPVDGQKWDTDPFTVVEKDGKLYGRGTGDMKGFLAIILALVPTFLQMQRKKPVHIAFSYGEEVGCTGAPVMTKYLQERNFSAEACVIGEPTHMLVYTGNKGYAQWRFKVTGKSIHSSMALMNTSVNAIEYGAFLIAKIREITVDLRENGPRDKEFDCPFSSITTGLIKGGVAVNTVPADCEFTITARLVESKLGDEIERKIRAHIDDVILPQMREEFPEASIDMVKEASYPAFHGDEHDRLTLKAREMLGDHDIHKTGGGTEAGIFLRDLKVPTIICGPGHASQAHVANEYVAVDKMDESMKFTLELTKFYVE